MKKFLILSLMLNLSAFAHGDPNCVPNHGLDIADIQKLLEWSGAQESQIRNAPCKTKAPLPEEEMLNFIAKKSTGKSRGSVHGVQFRNESPALIEAFEDFTTAMDGFGFYKDSKNQKKIQNEYKINPECEKVLCAMEKIWGRENAIKMLYIKLKHNYNTSDLAFSNSSPFTPEEMGQVLIGLEDVPERLVPVGKPNQRLTHFKRGYTLKDYSEYTLANAVIMLFDSWGNQSADEMQYTIFHEVAHNLASRNKNMDESPEWLKLSGWIKKGDTWKAQDNACFISNYGTTNPWEDFSEVVSAYRYNAQGLKKSCPEKYAFIKDRVYQGIEYLDSKLCSPISMNKLEQVQKDVARELVQSIEDKSFSQEEVTGACRGMIQHYPVARNEVAFCGVKLHAESSKTKELINQALKKVGAEPTSANRNMVLEGLVDELLLNDPLQQEISQKMTKLNQTVSQIVEKSFEDANAFTRPLTATDYSWRLEFEKCSGALFEGKAKETLECQAKQIIAKDRSMQKWNAGQFPQYKLPEIVAESAKGQFAKAREEKLLEYVLKQPSAQEAKEIMVKDFQEQMRGHRYEVSRKVSQLNDWKKLTPEEFCAQTYGAGTTFTDYYGVKSGAPISGFQKVCTEAQSQKSRRFEFKETEWNELVKKTFDTP
ncbi:hypothetical protein [Peredibacter starrii]|uniref:Uncharacterized protein n=1 Tax=Peredibacter starrii TaxID=28202 RepID=A0AAX4HU29_9BACT|nr:hypothetical protein [Peredibacter starrii]WPU66906.1 hypothetical protein SOO65_09100 [Peredibacter starrii]